MKGEAHKRDMIFNSTYKRIDMPYIYPSVVITVSCEGYIKVIMYIKSSD